MDNRYIANLAVLVRQFFKNAWLNYGQHPATHTPEVSGSITYKLEGTRDYRVSYQTIFDDFRAALNIIADTKKTDIAGIHCESFLGFMKHGEDMSVVIVFPNERKFHQWVRDFLVGDRDIMVIETAVKNRAVDLPSVRAILSKSSTVTSTATSTATPSFGAPSTTAPPVVAPPTAPFYMTALSPFTSATPPVPTVSSSPEVASHRGGASTQVAQSFAATSSAAPSSAAPSFAAPGGDLMTKMPTFLKVEAPKVNPLLLSPYEREQLKMSMVNGGATHGGFDGGAVADSAAGTGGAVAGGRSFIDFYTSMQKLKNDNYVDTRALERERDQLVARHDDRDDEDPMNAWRQSTAKYVIAQHLTPEDLKVIKTNNLDDLHDYWGAAPQLARLDDVFTDEIMVNFINLISADPQRFAEPVRETHGSRAVLSCSMYRDKIVTRDRVIIENRKEQAILKQLKNLNKTLKDQGGKTMEELYPGIDFNPKKLDDAEIEALDAFEGLDAFNWAIDDVDDVGGFGSGSISGASSSSSAKRRAKANAIDNGDGLFH